MTKGISVVTMKWPKQLKDEDISISKTLPGKMESTILNMFLAIHSYAKNLLL